MHRRLKWISEENRSNANECTTSNVLKEKKIHQCILNDRVDIPLGRPGSDHICFKIDLRM